MTELCHQAGSGTFRFRLEACGSVASSLGSRSNAFFQRDSSDRALVSYLAEHLFDLAGRTCLAEQVALNLAAAFRAEHFELLARFDPFGGRGNAETFPEPGNRPDDRDAIVVRGQFAHERLVDLDLVERKAAQVAQ